MGAFSSRERVTNRQPTRAQALKRSGVRKKPYLEELRVTKLGHPLGASRVAMWPLANRPHVTWTGVA
jgi:hypothetical protein